MAAIGTLAQTLQAGDEVVCTNNVYGGTFRLFENVYRKLGIVFHFVDSTDLSNVQAKISAKTKILFVETPTNPMLGITDIAAASELAHQNGARLIVDNTFMSPYLQNPLALGADAVVHSTTKYLNGHSDMVGGLILTSDDEFHERLRYLQNAAGAVPGPWDCWLALRGTKTLHVRMKRHEENARQIVGRLKDNPAVEKLYYPGLPEHPGHELAMRQQRGFGAMISFDVGSIERAQRVVQGVKIFTLAESLGGVESLISHPAVMTHAAVPKEQRDAMGVTEGLVRISVGIEDVEDLMADLESAFSA
jgi:cystathionine beta-lyase/cystathionine gamma-synthase